MTLFIAFFTYDSNAILPASMVTALGSYRWIRLPGISLSPVEFFKIDLYIFLSWSFP